MRACDGKDHKPQLDQSHQSAKRSIGVPVQKATEPFSDKEHRVPREPILLREVRRLRFLVLPREAAAYGALPNADLEVADAGRSSFRILLTDRSLAYPGIKVACARWKPGSWLQERLCDW
jgi:hypothetical protein